MSACALLVSLSSCYPQAPNPDQLRLAHEQNAALRQEIIRMQQLIKQAGEATPELTEQVEAKEQELTDALNELKVIKRQETEAKLRVIELNDRLDAFRANFRMLQNETANLHKRS
jgi:septal ring factor EnvC (AmiA/AmiB activator)